jgi:hypothetical protein
MSAAMMSATVVVVVVVATVAMKLQLQHEIRYENIIAVSQSGLYSISAAIPMISC